MASIQALMNPGFSPDKAPVQSGENISAGNHRYRPTDKVHGTALILIGLFMPPVYYRLGVWYDVAVQTLSGLARAADAYWLVEGAKQTFREQNKNNRV